MTNNTNPNRPTRRDYQAEGLCGQQVLTTDFEFAMAALGQDGKCKKPAGHGANHDVRDREWTPEELEGPTRHIHLS